jgi:hypothetical protein
MEGNPFSSTGNWYRGNTHSHTTTSDGKLPVAELTQDYQDRGYDFLVITDHNVVADVGQSRTTELLVIPGSEIAVCCDGTFGMEVCSLGIDEVRRSYVHPQQVIDDVLEQGGIPVISHPHMSGVYSGKMMELDGIAGIEVYNAYCQGSGRRGFAQTHWDDLLSVGRRVWGLASDDRHSGDRPGEPDKRDFDRFKAWVVVRAADCTRPAILDAMKKGLFYSTTGPQIKDIAIVDGEIHVATSPVRSITFATIPWLGSRQVAAAGEWLEAATVPLERVATPERAGGLVAGLQEHGSISKPMPAGQYFRVEIWDGGDGYAWSNPIFL